MAASTEALPDAAGPWEGGWHRFAPRLPSPNHGPRPAPGNPVDLIVLHSISLPPGEFGGTGGQQQFVDCDRRAWHAGQSSYRGRGQCNDDSIGIELEGLEGLHFEPAQYRTLAMLCRDIALRYPIAHIAGHQHIAPGRKQDPGPGFDWAQLQRAL